VIKQLSPKKVSSDSAKQIGLLYESNSNGSASFINAMSLGNPAPLPSYASCWNKKCDVFKLVNSIAGKAPSLKIINYACEL